MGFGSRLKLEGRSARNPRWGTFKTVLIEAESCSETLGSATARARQASRAVAAEL